jgi:hypothetical protein
MQYASFNYPKYIYQLPRPLGLKGLKKKRDLRKHCGGYYSPEPRPISGSHPGGSFYLGSDFEPGRYIKRADEIIRLNHTGWFIDDFQDQTMFGIVIFLPHGRFLAGWSMGEGMGSSYDGEIYTDAEEAARAADSLAENAAECEREYQEEEAARLEDEERNQGGDAEEQLKETMGDEI